MGYTIILKFWVTVGLVCLSSLDETMPLANEAQGDIVLGALQVADDGMRNRSAWTTSGQSHGSMFSQDINDFSCLSSEALNCSLRGTSPVSLLDSD